MASQQPNAWHNRQRQSNSASRTPQNRSNTASPSQPNPSQPPRPAQVQAAPPANNPWTQRNSGAGPSNGQLAQPRAAEAEQSVNGFNAAQVEAFLGRDAGVQVYKPDEVTSNARASGGAWGSKPSHTAANQPFFSQLAKQIATLEGGG